MIGIDLRRVANRKSIPIASFPLYRPTDIPKIQFWKESRKEEETLQKLILSQMRRRNLETVTVFPLIPVNLTGNQRKRRDRLVSRGTLWLIAKVT